MANAFQLSPALEGRDVKVSSTMIKVSYNKPPTAAITYFERLDYSLQPRGPTERINIQIPVPYKDRQVGPGNRSQIIISRPSKKVLTGIVEGRVGSVDGSTQQSSDKENESTDNAKALTLAPEKRAKVIGGRKQQSDDVVEADPTPPKGRRRKVTKKTLMHDEKSANHEGSEEVVKPKVLMNVSLKLHKIDASNKSPSNNNVEAAVHKISNHRQLYTRHSRRKQAIDAGNVVADVEPVIVDHVVKKAHRRGRRVEVASLESSLVNKDVDTKINECEKSVDDSHVHENEALDRSSDVEENHTSGKRRSRRHKEGSKRPKNLKNEKHSGKVLRREESSILLEANKDEVIDDVIEVVEKSLEPISSKTRSSRATNEFTKPADLLSNDGGHQKKKRSARVDKKSKNLGLPIEDEKDKSLNEITQRKSSRKRTMKRVDDVIERTTQSEETVNEKVTKSMENLESLTDGDIEQQMQNLHDDIPCKKEMSIEGIIIPTKETKIMTDTNSSFQEEISLLPNIEPNKDSPVTEGTRFRSSRRGVLKRKYEQTIEKEVILKKRERHAKQTKSETDRDLITSILEVPVGGETLSIVDKQQPSESLSGSQIFEKTDDIKNAESDSIVSCQNEGRIILGDQPTKDKNKSEEVAFSRSRRLGLSRKRGKPSNDLNLREILPPCPPVESSEVPAVVDIQIPPESAKSNDLEIKVQEEVISQGELPIIPNEPENSETSITKELEENKELAPPEEISVELTNVENVLELTPDNDLSDTLTKTPCEQFDIHSEPVMEIEATITDIAAECEVLCDDNLREETVEESIKLENSLKSMHVKPKKKHRQDKKKSKKNKQKKESSRRSSESKKSSSSHRYREEEEADPKLGKCVVLLHKLNKHDMLEHTQKITHKAHANSSSKLKKIHSLKVKKSSVTNSAEHKSQLVVESKQSDTDLQKKQTIDNSESVSKIDSKVDLGSGKRNELKAVAIHLEKSNEAMSHSEVKIQKNIEETHAMEENSSKKSLPDELQKKSSIEERIAEARKNSTEVLNISASTFEQVAPPSEKKTDRDDSSKKKHSKSERGLKNSARHSSGSEKGHHSSHKHRRSRDSSDSSIKSPRPENSHLTPRLTEEIPKDALSSPPSQKPATSLKLTSEPSTPEPKDTKKIFDKSLSVTPKHKTGDSKSSSTNKTLSLTCKLNRDTIPTPTSSEAKPGRIVSLVNMFQNLSKPAHIKPKKDGKKAAKRPQVVIPSLFGPDQAWPQDRSSSAAASPSCVSNFLIISDINSDAGKAGSTGAVDADASRDGSTLPPGWTRVIHTRACGASQGKRTVIFYSPNGRRIASKAQLEDYLLRNQLPFKVEQFSFSVCGRYSSKKLCSPKNVKNCLSATKNVTFGRAESASDENWHKGSEENTPTDVTTIQCSSTIESCSNSAKTNNPKTSVLFSDKAKQSQKKNPKSMLKCGKLTAAWNNIEKKKLPRGWKRKVRVNPSGRVYFTYFTHDGLRIRSKPEMLKYLVKTNSNLKLEQFYPVTSSQATTSLSSIIKKRNPPKAALKETYKSTMQNNTILPLEVNEEGCYEIGICSSPGLKIMDSLILEDRESAKKMAKIETEETHAITTSTETTEVATNQSKNKSQAAKPMSLDEAYALYQRLEQSSVNVPSNSVKVDSDHKGDFAAKVQGMAISSSLTTPRAERRLNQLFSAKIRQDLCSTLEDEDPSILSQWIQKIIDCRPELHDLDDDAMESVSAAAVYFVRRLAASALKGGSDQVLTYEKIAAAVAADKSLTPLRPMIPRKITYREFRRRNRPTKYYSFTV